MAAKKRGNWLKWMMILLLIGGGAWAWSKQRAKGKDTPAQIKSVPVERGDIVQAVTANGQITPVVNVQVGTQVSGIIRELYVDFNSRVTNGQVIARIDPSTYEQAITQSEAELANANAALLYAQVNHKRANELHANDLLAESEYDKTVADLRQAEAVVKMREASLKRAQVDLERTTIFAPVDGVVISRAVDVGQTVAASFNTPTLFQIANDLRNMRIEAMVSEADVGGVEEDQRVNFTVDAFPSRQFRGVVSQVRYAPITNQNVVSYTCVVDVNNSDLKLRPGMTATASIVTGERKEVLRIPNSALRFRPPEDLLPKESKAGTNSAAASTAVLSPDSRESGATARAQGGSGGRGEGGRPNPEEMRRRFENMSPEERERMRQRFQARGGGNGGEGGFGGFGAFRGGGAPTQEEGPVTRTVYVMERASANSKPKVKPVTIKTGISDGSFTEVLEGLEPGMEIATGVSSPILAGPAVPQGQSPFGGGGFRRR